MSERGETVGRLELVGYEKVSDHGLALPVFGRSQGANVYYTAHSSSPGEANGQIAGFDSYDPDGLICLPVEQIRVTGVGEPWLDVFLWEGTAYVGTAPEIWNSLAELRESIAEHAPLSLLTLAEGAGDPQRTLQLAKKAFSWLSNRHGREKALDWRNDTYLRGIVLKGLRRELGAFADRDEVRRALRVEVVLHQVGNKITAYIGHPLPSLRAEDRNIFTTAAANFGLEAQFTFEVKVSETSSRINTRSGQIARNRTSENEMRIAALQVAASKPQGRATTTELKNEVDQYVALTPEDLLPSKTRPNETMYQQIVGNVVSHRASKNNIFAKGWANYTGDGIQITDAGRQHLRTLGLPS